MATGYYCKFCKGKHADQATLKQCYMDYYARMGYQKSMNFITDELQMDSPAAWSILHPKEILPTGLYLTMMNTPRGGAHPVQIRVGNITTGKWAGISFVSYYDEDARKYVPVYSNKDRDTVLNKLKNGNWQRALLSYGRTFGNCPICERPLAMNERPGGVHKDSACYSKVFG